MGSGSSKKNIPDNLMIRVSFTNNRPWVTLLELHLLTINLLTVNQLIVNQPLVNQVNTVIWVSCLLHTLLLQTTRLLEQQDNLRCNNTLNSTWPKIILVTKVLPKGLFKPLMMLGQGLALTLLPPFHLLPQVLLLMLLN